MDQELNECSTQITAAGSSSDDYNSFEYGPSDVAEPYDHPMSMRGNPLALYSSTMTIAISFHWMAVCQHHDVVALSYGTDSMRSNITCSLDSRLVCFTCLIVCSISCCIVTRIAFFRLYCWRVRLFRFFFWCEICGVTAGGGSNCGSEVDDLIADGVDVTVC